MKLEDQVCSLELAKCLKELGVKQESLFVWVENSLGVNVALRNDLPPDDRRIYVAAFTVAELGEMIGNYIDSSYKGTGGWYVFERRTDGLKEFYAYEKTEADARAQTLIYLIEEGKVKP